MSHQTPMPQVPTVAAPVVVAVANLTATEVAEITRVPVNTLAWWRHVGRGPRWYRVGGRRVLYRRDDLDAWLAEQYETTGTSESR